MSAFKQLTTRDVTIAPFSANKGFTFSGSAITASGVDIDIFQGVKPIGSTMSELADPTGLITTQNTTGVYNSAKQLYYSNFLLDSKGDTVPTASLLPGALPSDNIAYGPTNAPRYENYLQSTLTQSRNFPTDVGGRITTVSIPQKLYGENIVPTTFSINYTSASLDFNVIDDGEGNLILTSNTVGGINSTLLTGTNDITLAANVTNNLTGMLSNSFTPTNINFSTSPVLICDIVISSGTLISVSSKLASGNFTIGDQFTVAGSLLNASLGGSLTITITENLLIPPYAGVEGDIVGQVFYPHGIAVFTTSSLSQMGLAVSSSPILLNSFDVSFSSSITIYEHQYKCMISENEFGYSQNPSIISSSFGLTGSQNDVYYDFATGSYFDPYITTVGLYNGNSDLVAVAKLSYPTPVSKFCDTTIMVNFDT